jgi:DnaJ-class molecular chaperone
VVTVEVPTKISREQRKILESFEKETEIKSCPQMKEYKDKVEMMYGKNPYGK